MTIVRTLGGAWTWVAVALLGSGAVFLQWMGAVGSPCGAGEACGARAPKGEPGIAHIEGGPRLVEFSSEDCPACARMRPVVAGVERECGAEKSIAHVDVDDAAGERLAGTYGVSLLPTFVSVDAQGREVARLTGVQSSQALQRALEEVRGTRCGPPDEGLGTRPL